MTVKQWLSVYEKAVKLKLSLPEIPKLVNQMFRIRVSYKTAWKRIRGKLKLPYSKPYVLDNRRPENAEEQLKS